MVDAIKVQTPLREFIDGYVIRWDEEALTIMKNGNQVAIIMT
jgi:hypothetical protein